jgi:hypothetical protein
VCWERPRRRVRPYWGGLAHGCGPRGRQWNFRKDILVGGLQFGDLTRYLVLTGGELRNNGNVRLYKEQRPARPHLGR